MNRTVPSITHHSPMRKFLLGLTFGLLASAAAASAAFPAQLPSAFASGQLLLASSLEDLRQAVNGMLGAFDASGNVAASKVATGSSFRFVTDAQVSSWDSKLGASSVIPAAQILTGSSFRFVTEAEKAAWNSKISSASGALFATLSGGTVPLAQLPPVFDAAGLNVLASAVSTSAGARFVTDAQVAAWNAKLDMAAAAPLFAPLSGGIVPAQYLPASVIASGSGAVGVAELSEFTILDLGGLGIPSTAYTKCFEHVVGVPGTFRFRTKVLLYGPTCVRVYKNNVPFGPEHCTSAYGVYTTFEDDLAVARGDVLQLFAYGNGSTISNFKIVTNYTPPEIRAVRDAF